MDSKIFFSIRKVFSQLKKFFLDFQSFSQRRLLATRPDEIMKLIISLLEYFAGAITIRRKYPHNKYVLVYRSSHPELVL